MSILDGMIQSEVDPKALIGILGPMAEKLFDAIASRSPYGELIRQGHAPADILGLTKAHRDAIMMLGYRAMQAGNVQKARDVAAKLFVQYLALDATCAKGHLRLGECFLTAQELERAASCFRVAEAEAERGNGDDNTRRRAEKLLAICEERIATASGQNA